MHPVLGLGLVGMAGMIDLDTDPPYAKWECDKCEKGIGYTDAPKNTQDWDWANTPHGVKRLCLQCLEALQ